jgi:hypothetical protein
MILSAEQDRLKALSLFSLFHTYRSESGSCGESFSAEKLPFSMISLSSAKRIASMATLANICP